MRILGGFLLGLIVSGSVFVYFAITDDKKIEELTALVQRWKEKYVRMEDRLKRVLDELGTTERDLKERQREIEGLREENRRLKREIKRLSEVVGAKHSGKAAQPSAPQPLGESDKKRTAEEAAKRFRQLLQALTLNPTDIQLLSAVMDISFKVKDRKLLDEALRSLAAILERQEREMGETALVCYMRAVLCGLRMAAVQMEMRKDPSKGAVLAMRMGEIAAESLKWLDKAVELDPKEASFRLSRGWWRFHTPGITEKAGEDFRWIVDVSKKRSVEKHILEQAYLGLILWLRRKGRKEEAEQKLQEALHLFPNSKNLLRLQNK